MKRIFGLISLLGVLALTGCGATGTDSNATSGQSQSHHVQTASKANQQSTTKIVKTIDWWRPSEKKPYPSMTVAGRWLKVSTNAQRVYVMGGKKVLYTMNASTGKDHSTPLGTYHIQAERGKFFYNASSKEGAHYWTSFKDHGVYLFHTVPTNAKGHYLKSEAAQLGKTANSHGCIRLSIPDAKWINRSVPTGTKVVIS